MYDFENPKEGHQLISTRRMDMEDVSNAVRLIRDYDYGFRSFKDTELISYIEKSLREEDVHWYLAEEAEKILGFLMFSETNENEIRVNELFVSPSFRRRDVGTKLMDIVKDFARKGNFSRICLTVRLENQTARTFYTKQGFVPEGQVRNFYGKGRHGILLAFYL